MIPGVVTKLDDDLSADMDAFHDGVIERYIALTARLYPENPPQDHLISAFASLCANLQAVVTRRLYAQGFRGGNAAINSMRAAAYGLVGEYRNLSEAARRELLADITDAARMGLGL